MTGSLALSPLETLFRMSRLAFIQGLIYSFLSGELASLHLGFSFSNFHSPTSLMPLLPSRNQVSQTSDFFRSYSRCFQRSRIDRLSKTKSNADSYTLKALALLGNGILAFVLNTASFSANKHTGALTMTVCGNVKQCLTVLLGIIVFGVKVGWLNGLGMLVTLSGAAWYSALELQGKSEK